MQCTATNRQGGRCKNPAIQGGNVCRFHGGKAPQVERAAGRRVLEALVGPALVVLKSIVDDETLEPRVRLAAARDILDRTGYAPAKQVEVITMGAVEAEIARLEAELAAAGE